MGESKKSATVDHDALPGLSGAEEVQLPNEIQGQISRQLRQVYDKILSEPLPDKFADLLNELSKSEPKK